MTVLPPVPHVSTETILKDSWNLLRRNWSLITPMLLSGLAFGVAIVAVLVAVASAGLFVPHPSDRAIATFVIAYGVLFVAGLFVTAIAVDATFGMADAAWTTGKGTFAAGGAAIRTRFFATLVAFLGYAGAVLCAVVLVIPTLGVALLAFPLITMYVLPAVVVGGSGGFGGFRESWRLVRRYFGTSVVAMLILYAFQYLISTVFSFALMPLEFGLMAAAGTDGKPSYAALGGLGILLLIVVLVMLVVLFAYQAYFTLALTGLYRWLHARADDEDRAAAAGVPLLATAAVPEPPAPPATLG